jgi:diguanylate cyclase
MSYKESYGRAASIAKEAMEQMDNLEIAAHPDNFEIWYAFHAGIDAELSRQLSGLLESVEEFDPHSYQDIKQSYLGEDAGQVIQSATESVEDIIGKAVTSIGAAADNVKDYGSKLQGFSGDLSGAAPDQIQALVKKALLDAKEAITKNAALEKELNEASASIDELQNNLDDPRRASETDGLTGLPNRRAFDLGLEAEIARAREDRTAMTLLITDVDHFKRFNDTYGHRVGDEVLKLVGRVMKSMLKGRDIPARYGGEEFCIILPTTDLKGGMIVAEQIRKTIAAKVLKSAKTGQSYGNVTLSIGAALLQPADTMESIVERADAALYLAKHSGRNRVATERDLQRQRAGKVESMAS